MFTFTLSGGWVSDRPYPQRFQAAKDLGFEAIEMLEWRGEDLSAARAEIDRTGVQLSAILCRSVDRDTSSLIENEHGIVWEDAQEAFVTCVRETLAAAQALNCKNIVVTTGNERSDVSRQVQHDNVVKALRAAAQVVKGSGVKLVLEPLNVIISHKGYYLVTTQEGAQIIDEVDSPDVRLLYDVFHQQISEGNITWNLRRYMDRIGHIHIGDVPDRNQPGTGEINYRRVFQVIRELGYQGFVALECGCTEPVPQACRKMLALLED